MNAMETIHNIANTASKAIWGDTNPHEEPVSGKMGNVAAGEPYDAGNIGGENPRPLRNPQTYPCSLVPQS